jgi:hypothetical protein
MGAAATIGLVVSVTLAGLLAAALAGKLVLRSLEGPLSARIAAALAPEAILRSDLAANCFGVASKGVWQVRGNGALVLARDGLHFFMVLPADHFHVPVGTITGLSFRKHFLGKATIYDLLVVDFEAGGRADSAAWFVRDPRGWREAIERLQAGGT